MTRADRGIEKIAGANDLASTRALTSLDVLLGGVGGVPEDLGIKVSKSLFAPRLGAIYRLNDETVFRTGYGITYNPLPFSRSLRGFFPLTLASDFTHPIRTVGHDVSSRAFPTSWDPTSRRGTSRCRTRTSCARPWPTSRAAGYIRGTRRSSESCHMTSP